ncbi:MAG: HEPN domain-containing protein [Alphaproteobacteria bacterium]|nr:HEPN domain-containing protein [Alphaproteobacteria bacterium]
MTADRDILITALEIAVPAHHEKNKEKRTSVLGQPPPGPEIMPPLIAAIEKCATFRTVAGNYIFSADSGVVIHAPRLASDLFSRAEKDISAAVDWLLRVLTTKNANGLFKALLWGISVEQEATILPNCKLLPLEQLSPSHIQSAVCNRARKLWDGSIWQSIRSFDKPKAALIIECTNFPYIRGDSESFDKLNEINLKAKEIWTIVEATFTGHPLVAGSWFEYEDRELDIASFENYISWNLPEIAPRLRKCTPADAHAITHNLSRYSSLPKEMQSNLLRSMNRYTLSQCRHQMIDRVLDLALAFEIALSGKNDKSPPSWKVSVRAAQLIGGSLERRQGIRTNIYDLYVLRNKGTHGSKLEDEKIEAVVQKASLIYVEMTCSFLRLGQKPDWNEIELSSPFTD